MTNDRRNDDGVGKTGRTRKRVPVTPGRKTGNVNGDGTNAAPRPYFLADAPRQPSTAQAWARFGRELALALRALEEDEWLIVLRKNRNRFVQFMNQGGAGFRAEAVSDFYLPEDDCLSEGDRHALLGLGWGAPTRLPDEFGHDPDGSPNYFVDLANPVPIEELAALAVNTLALVYGAEHPGDLEYSTGSAENASIRFPNLGIRRALDLKRTESS